MKFVIDSIKKADNSIRFLITGRFKPESDEDELYASMIDIQKDLAKPDSSLTVASNILILRGSPIESCVGVLNVFRRSYNIDINCSLSKDAVVTPKGADAMVLTELNTIR